jgi:hypothetical protein
MLFKKKVWIDKHAKNVDKLVTWIIIWWAIASMIWLSRTDKWKDITKNVKDGSVWVAKKGYSVFWKVLVWCLKVITPKKDNNKK